MKSFKLSLVVALLSLLMVAPAAAQSLSQSIITPGMARRHGLERMWVTRARLDAGQGKLLHIAQSGNMLLLQTDLGIVQALDIETGRTLWISSVGKVGYPVHRAAANDKVVAAVSGARVYILDRLTGDLLTNMLLGGAPSAGPALGDSDVEGEEWVYVPLTSGVLDMHNYGGGRIPSMLYHGTGMAENPPILTDNNVMWATDRGYVFAAEAPTLQPNFRFATLGPVIAQLAYHDGRVYAGAQDGYLYCLSQNRGRPLWEFSTGSRIYFRPIVIDKALYVTTEELGVFRLDAVSGRETWHSPGMQQIVSISSKHVYGMDGSGRLLVLDAKSGARLDAMPTHGLSLIHTNTQTDRLILATQTGLVQCLREAGQGEPMVHNPQVKKPVAAPADAKTPDVAVPADEGDDPFNADENAAEDPAMDEEPADEEAVDDEAMDAEEEPADDEAVDEEGDDPFGS